MGSALFVSQDRATPSSPPVPMGAPTGPGASPSSTSILPGSVAEDLARAQGFDQIFQVVRRAVKQVLGRERTGLGLALSDLPPGVGAYWPVTGNLIVMNEGILETMRRMARSPLEFNCFVYVILAHEYLHAIGYWGEGPVRSVTSEVTRRAFGEDHPATAMAEGDLWERFPFLRFSPGGRGRKLRMVPGFDTSATSSYIR